MQKTIIGVPAQGGAQQRRPICRKLLPPVRDRQRVRAEPRRPPAPLRLCSRAFHRAFGRVPGGLWQEHPVLTRLHARVCCRPADSRGLGAVAGKVLGLEEQRPAGLPQGLRQVAARLGAALHSLRLCLRRCWARACPHGYFLSHLVSNLDQPSYCVAEHSRPRKGLPLPCGL